MIYQFIDNLFEIIYIVRHFFRAFACKSYFVESHGVSMCDKTQGCCEWYWCPKRKGGDNGMTKEEAIKILKQERWYMSRYSEEYKEAYDMAIEALSERQKGEWVEDGCVTKCNICGEVKEFPHWNFCPSCGARMENKK